MVKVIGGGRWDGYDVIITIDDETQECDMIYME